MPGRRASSLPATRDRSETAGRGRGTHGGERVYRWSHFEEAPLQPGRVLYPAPVAGQWVRINRVECTED
eukprot:4325547-Alexandrium_andersonii.AAC.1